MTTNEDLRFIYDQHYAACDQWHTPVDTWEESLLIHRVGGDWRGQMVLEIGCGEGRLANLLAESGAYQVNAVDYSAAAITIAHSRYQRDNLLYVTGCVGDVANRYDVIVMQGVLEHTDDPWLRLEEYVRDYLTPGGHIITSSPAFLNPRGYVWQTLRLLLNVPMSLTDLHAINPWDMQAWCIDNRLPLHYEACHHDWGAGELMLTDYANRLPKALADAGLPTDGVPRLLEWLRVGNATNGYYVPTEWSGATIVYKIGPKP